jgi:hypothetical protein
MLEPVSTQLLFAQLQTSSVFSAMSVSPSTQVP